MSNETSDEARSRGTVGQYYAAMRRGAPAEDEMLALFAEDAVYVEPFSGLDPAVGKEQIRARLRAGWEQPLPEFELDVLTMAVTETVAECTWECRSPALAAPQRGRDRYELVDGLIVRLDVGLLSRPGYEDDD